MRRQKRANRGIALIIVLGMVFLYALFASMMVIAGRISTISERVHTRRTEAKYAAESATAMAMWPLLLPLTWYPHQLGRR